MASKLFSGLLFKYILCSCQQAWLVMNFLLNLNFAIFNLISHRWFDLISHRWDIKKFFLAVLGLSKLPWCKIYVKETNFKPIESLTCPLSCSKCLQLFNLFVSGATVPHKSELIHKKHCPFLRCEKSVVVRGALLI